MMVSDTEDELVWDELPCAFCQVREDSSLSIRKTNFLFYQLFGYDRTTDRWNRPGSLREVVYPAAWKQVLEQIRGLRETGCFEMELEFVNRQGEIIWCLIRCRRSLDSVRRLNFAMFDITERIRRLERMSSIHAERNLLLHHTKRYLFYYYIETRVAVMPPESAAELGLPELVENCPNGIVNSCVAVESKEDFLEFHRQMYEGRREGSVAVKFRNSRDVFEWYRCDFSMVYAGNGKPDYAIVSFANVNKQWELELAYRKWKEYNKKQLKDSLIYYECNLDLNSVDKIEGPMAGQIPGTVTESYQRMISHIEDHFICSEDREKFRCFYSRENLLKFFAEGTREAYLEYRRIGEDKELMWSAVTVQILMDPYSGNIKTFFLVRSIDDEKKRELSLLRQLQTDGLTKVLNRATFIEKLNGYLRCCTYTGYQAFVILDLDHFKELNDSMGHQTGDQALMDVALALENTLRNDDLIGRLGGDEFVVCIKNFPSLSALEQKIQTICGRLRFTYGKSVPMSASIGVAVFPEHGSNFRDLYEKADAALYRAKAVGRGSYMIYGNMQSDLRIAGE